MKATLTRALVSAEEGFDAIGYRLKRRLGLLGHVTIQPYRGFGTERRFVLDGRVLEDKGLEQPDPDDTVFENVRSMYKRFESDEIPHARLRVRFGEEAWTLETDAEGYFHLDVAIEGPIRRDRLWQEVTCELLEPEQEDAVAVTGHVLVPPPESTYGVISDIDDTVLVTGAARRWEMVRRTVFGNSRTRVPFPGVSAFYQALRGGPDGHRQNPIFYVSSSPWNLYDFFVHFMDHRALPLGPLMLRDLGLDQNKVFKSSHSDHKLKQISRVLETFPDLPFILVGDSGQHDPEIYQQATQDFPGRVQGIYIRDVTAGARDAEVHAIAEQVERSGVPMRLVQDTLGAARHAVAEGWIPEAALAEVAADRARDVM